MVNSEVELENSLKRILDEASPDSRGSGTVPDISGLSNREADDVTAASFEQGRERAAMREEAIKDWAKAETKPGSDGKSPWQARMEFKAALARSSKTQLQ